MATADLDFGLLALDPLNRSAVYAGDTLPLTPKAVALLAYLAQHRHRPVGKAELLEQVWPAVEVEESNLTQTVFMARKALREAGSPHEWIVTVPHAGYRFVVPDIEAARPTTPRPRVWRWLAAPAAIAGMVVALASWTRDSDPEAVRASSRPEVADSGRAWTAYREGRAALALRTVPSLASAVAAFRRATVADPAFAQAYSGLAAAYSLSGIFGGIPRRDAERWSLDSAARAIALDPSLAEAHTALAFVQHIWQKRWADAEARYRRAIALDPGFAPAHHWYALLLDSLVRPDEALREMRMATALLPQSAVMALGTGMVLAHQGQVEEAVQEFRRALAIDPGYANAHQEMAWACALAGRYAEAEAAFTEAARLSMPRPNVLAGLGFVYARSGRTVDAHRALQEIRATAMADEGLHDALQAQVLLGFGDHDAALELLLRAHPDGEPNLRVGRIYDPIRDDPRFKELLRRSGLL